MKAHKVEPIKRLVEKRNRLRLSDTTRGSRQRVRRKTVAHEIPRRRLHSE